MSTIAMAETGKGENLKLEVRRVIRASRERVFAAWTSGEAIRKWFGSANSSTLHAEAEAREGGRYRICTTFCTPGPNGEAKLSGVSGEYLKVIPNQLLCFTWEPEWNPSEQSLVTVELSDLEGGTELVLRHERFASEDSRNRHEQGWMGAMDKLSAYAAAPLAEEPLRLEMRRVIRASRERVFAAWTQPEQLKKWFGPGAVHAAEVEMETRPGGAYHIVMQGSVEGNPEDAERRMSIDGAFTEVILNELISYTWRPQWSPGEESQVTVLLRDVEGGTELLLRHERFATAESCAGHARGWASGLGKLEGYLA